MCWLHSIAPTQADLVPLLSLKTDCRKDIGNDAEWLDINLGPFSTVANYTDLKELNISGVNHQFLLCFSSHTALREPLDGSHFCLFLSLLVCFLFFFFSVYHWMSHQQSCVICFVSGFCSP